MSTVRATLLKRYTHLPALLSLLQSKEITLLTPAAWDDKNDRVFMEQYARKTGKTTVLGVCFTQAAETYHHWKVFAPGAAGVCIEFQKTQMLASIPKNGFKHKKVAYENAVSLLASYATASDLPFIKGAAYRDEKEYRIIYASETEELLAKSFPFQLSCIRRIVVNPWLPEPLFEATKDAIARAPGCSRLLVTQSKVIDNRHWQSYAKSSA
jgi:hypothetical protein